MKSINVSHFPATKLITGDSILEALIMSIHVRVIILYVGQLTLDFQSGNGLKLFRPPKWSVFVASEPFISFDYLSIAPLKFSAIVHTAVTISALVALGDWAASPG